MTEVQKFFAFRLPDHALLQVMKKMNYLQLISLSLVSKRSKKLVKSLKLPCYRIGVTIDMDSEFSIEVRPRSTNLIDFRFQTDESGPRNLHQRPARVPIDFRYDTHEEQRKREEVISEENYYESWSENQEGEDENEIGSEDDVGEEQADNDQEEEDDGSEHDAEEDESDEDQSEAGGFRRRSTNSSRSSSSNLSGSSVAWSFASTYTDEERMVRCYEKHEWINQGLRLQEWAHHIHYLYPDSTPFELIINPANLQFDIASLRHDLPQFSDLDILRPEYDDDHRDRVAAHTILRTFAGDVKILDFGGSAFNAGYTQQPMLHNFDELKLYVTSEAFLDDLLALNARKIEYRNPDLSIATVNRFLKSWMRGSNPRLCHLQLDFVYHNVPDVNLILKGIKHKVFGEDVESVNERADMIIRGRFEIKNVHGKIAILRRVLSTAIELVVWN